MNDDMAIVVSDGHDWTTKWRTADGTREMAECTSHGKDPGCGIKKFRDGDTWTTGPHAPWVDPEHVKLHAKSAVAQKG
jgi:hypothetical protein